MNNYNFHYKDRQPLDTVEKINNFFNSKNLTVKVHKKMHSEIGTYSSVINLYNKNNTLLLSTNGKGMTEEYSLASGYAELYERYCNFGALGVCDNYIYSQFLQKHKREKNYYHHPKEKMTSIKEMFINSPNNFKKYFCKNDIENSETYNFFKLLFNGEECAVAPYINFITQETLYLNPCLAMFEKGSGGMCAGNTLEEALNQGISELFEHYVTGFLFSFPKNLKFHYIDIDLIQDNRIQEIINIIRQQNKDIKIIDFSYNFNIPVVMGILYDYETSKTFINLGSFPVFEIAVERILTELYQGYENTKEIKTTLIPSRHCSVAQKVFESLSCVTLAPFINEQLFLNKVEHYAPNKNVFLFKDNDNYNNHNILQYYKQLCSKYNYDIYYLDNSQTSDMYALQVYSTNLSHFPEIINHIQNHSYGHIYNLYNNLFLFEKTLLETNTSHFYYLKNILHNPMYPERVFSVIGAPYLSLYSNCKDFEAIILSMLMDSTPLLEYTIIDAATNTFLENNINKYLIIYRYAISTRYTDQEKITILNEILKENLSIKDLESIQETGYLIKKLFLESIYEHYHSEEYQEVLNAFI